MAIENNTLEKKKDSFSSKYDERWQKSLVSLLVKDPIFAEQFSDVVDIRLFDQKISQLVVKYIFEFRRRFGEYPSKELLESSLMFFASDDKQREVLKGYVSELRLDEKVSNEQFIKDSAISFCKNKKMINVIRELAEMSRYELGEEDFSVALKKMEEAVHAGMNYDRGHLYKESLLKRYSSVSRIPITTGIPKLDALVAGGLGKGELGLVVGGTGSGKSMFLVWLASQAASHGFNVIYYTMELSETEIGKRVDACLTNTPLNLLIYEQEKIQEAIQKLPGTILIKEYPMKQCSINTIRSHITKEITLANKPDVIFIDYVDTMQFSSKYSELRHNLQIVMEELRGIAKEFNIAVWTASQTNRDGYSNSNPGLEHISEAFSKTFSTDFTLTIGRTDKEKKSGEAVYKIAKNRNGIDGISFFGKMDTLRVQISFEDELTIESKVSREIEESEDATQRVIDYFFEMEKEHK